MTDPFTQVKQNLLFYNLWTQVSEITLSNDVLLQGIPKEPLLNDEVQDQTKTNQEKPFTEGQSKNEVIPKNNKKEIVLPFHIHDELTPKRLNSIFNELEKETGTRPKRIIIGIVNDDSTIVYYFIHDGVYKPKKN